MHVVGVQPARDPVACGDGPIRIGSAPGDDIILAGPGVERHHASIEQGRCGLVLTVTPGCARVYVNARAVREQALLHYGDTVTLGNHKLRIIADSAPIHDDAAAAAAPARNDIGPVCLRIVSGTDSGQALEVGPALHLGVGCRHFGTLPFACRVERVGGGLRLQTDGTPVRINGWRCQRAALADGDQIALGEHRLLVEAPGLRYAAYTAQLPPAPTPMVANAPTPPAVERSQLGIWVLVLVAALLAAGTALILYFPL